MPIRLSTMLPIANPRDYQVIWPLGTSMTTAGCLCPRQEGMGRLDSWRSDKTVQSRLHPLADRFLSAARTLLVRRYLAAALRRHDPQAAAGDPERGRCRRIRELLADRHRTRYRRPEGRADHGHEPERRAAGGVLRVDRGSDGGVDGIPDQDDHRSAGRGGPAHALLWEEATSAATLLRTANLACNVPAGAGLGEASVQFDEYVGD